jgi:hypothetical protein
VKFLTSTLMIRFLYSLLLNARGMTEYISYLQPARMNQKYKCVYIISFPGNAAGVARNKTTYQRS